MSDLSIHLLGTFHINYRGKMIDRFHTERERALLAYLAVERDRPHRRETLMGLLWSELTDERARNNLRVNLHRLRKALETETTHKDWLLIGRDYVQLNPSAPVWLDVAAFDAHHVAARHLAARNSAAHPGRLQHLVEACRLYRGDFLQGFSLDDNVGFAEWVTHAREQWHRIALETLYDLCAMHIRRGELAQALAAAQRQLDLEPWREEAHRQVMEILGRRGERSAALAQFKKCREVLAEELGVEPAEQTRQLATRIEQLSLARVRNLPATASKLIGRRTELDQITTHLSDPNCRLLTLTGHGGSGKTRLAIAAATHLSAAFLHGVCYVPLVALNDANQIAPGILNALGLPLIEPAEPEIQLCNYLCERELLVVLDNCEHLLPALKPLIAQLLQLPHIKLLITSRERLHIKDETVMVIGGLILLADAPPAAYSAGQLFLAHARRLRPLFDPGQDDARAVAQICRLVDGMPLALELAAGWLNVLSPSEIAAELQQHLALLSSAEGGTTSRHQSMEIVFEQSWERLTAPERDALMRLSIFVGPFDRHAAKGVAQASLSILVELVNMSLVQHLAPGTSSLSYYTLHPLLRRFASDKLSEDPVILRAVQVAFIDHYSRFLEERGALLIGPDHSRAIADMLAVYDNVRAALLLACELGSVKAIGRSLFSLLGVTYMTSIPLVDARRLFDQMAKAVESETRSRVHSNENEAILARAVAYHAWFCLFIDERDVARKDLERALSLAKKSGDQEIEASIVNGLGLLARDYGDLAEAEMLFRQALEIIDPPSYRYTWWQQGSFYMHLSSVSLRRKELTQAKMHLENARRAFTHAESALGLAATLRELGDTYLQEEDYPAARIHYEEALDVTKQLGARIYEVQVLIRLGRLALLMGENKRGHDLLEQAGNLGEELGAARMVDEVRCIIKATAQ